MTHVSVLCREVVDALELQPIDDRKIVLCLDATLGRGGHAEAWLMRSAPFGRLIGVDRDPEAIAICKQKLERFEGRVLLSHSRFSDLKNVVRSAQAQWGTDKLDALMADLGVSSPQVDTAERGFSFRFDGPLDMRMDSSSGPTVIDAIADADESELADVIYRYGEERQSRRIARVIKEAQRAAQLQTTADLERAVMRAVGRKPGLRINPATRTFQALRIWINDELAELESLMKHLPSVLRSGGRAAIISFHSLEDRIVKNTFKGSPVWQPWTKKPMVPSEQEIADNPRARSAKLRVATFLGQEASR